MAGCMDGRKRLMWNCESWNVTVIRGGWRRRRMRERDVGKVSLGWLEEGIRKVLMCEQVSA